MVQQTVALVLNPNPWLIFKRKSCWNSFTPFHFNISNAYFKLKFQELLVATVSKKIDWKN